MKSKIAAFSIIIIIFIYVVSLSAQPGCQMGIFNPFDTYFYGDTDFVVSGSVISLENLKDWVRFKGGNTNFSVSRTKIKIQVNEELKGNLNEKQIEVYVGNDCGLNQVGGTRIFKLKKSFIGDSAIWVSDKVSYPIDEYSKQGKEEVLTKVKSDLKTNNEHNLYGVIIEKFADNLSYSESGEIQLKLGYNPINFKPMVRIVVEAKRKKDGKIFKTITDKDGKFAFKNLSEDEYQVYPLLPKGYERVGVYPNAPDGYQQHFSTVNIRYNWSHAREVFKVQTVGNLTGKIEHIPLDFKDYEVKTWKVNNLQSYTDESSFPLLSRYPVLVTTTNSTFEFSFFGYPTGKYIIGIIGGKKTTYYPGTTDREKAKIFEIKKSKTTDISFRVP